MYILTDKGLSKLLVKLNRPQRLQYSGSTFIPVGFYTLIHVTDNTLYSVYDTKEKVFKDVTLEDFMKQSNIVDSRTVSVSSRFNFSHIGKRTGKSLEVLEHSVVRNESKILNDPEMTFLDFATVDDKSIKFLEHIQSITLERKRPKDADILVIDRKVGDNKITGSYRNNFYNKDSLKYTIYNKYCRPLLRSLDIPLLSFGINMEDVIPDFNLSYEADLLGFMILISELTDTSTNGVAIHVDYLTRNSKGVLRYNTSWLVVKFKPTYKAFITKYLVLNHQ